MYKSLVTSAKRKITAKRFKFFMIFIDFIPLRLTVSHTMHCDQLMSIISG